MLTHMAVTGSKFCDFVIYSRQGMYHNIIHLMKQSLSCWLHQVSCSLETICFYSFEGMTSLTKLCLITRLAQVFVMSSSFAVMKMCLTSKQSAHGMLYHKQKIPSTTGAQGGKTCLRVWLCNDECMYEDGMESESENSVLCEKCLKWFHMLSVDYVENTNWKCTACENNQ